MLEFINNNSVLFSGIFSIIGILISTFATIIHDNRKMKRHTSPHPRKKSKKPKADKTHKSKHSARPVDNGKRTVRGAYRKKEHKEISVSLNIHSEKHSNIRYYADYCDSCEFNTDHGKYEKTV